MVRFDLPSNCRAPNYLSWRQQWRLLVLVAAMGLVILTMKRLSRPETAALFDSMLTGASADAPFSEADLERSTGVWNALDGIDWSAVRDNSFFRQEESEAWFAVLAQLHEANSDELASKSLGEVTYTQLTDQSEIYRGKLVTVRGTVRRTETLNAPANKIGLARYYRLTIQLAGESTWPVIAYCLELPAGYPAGENTAPPVVITGAFFKTWSYTWEGGMGAAPVILAKAPDWSPIATMPPAPTDQRNPLVIVLIGGAVAAAILTLVWWNSRRYGKRVATLLPIDAPPNSADVATAMQNLAEMNPSSIGVFDPPRAR